MKRIVCLIAAVCVCFCSAFAWTSESFVSDGSEEYSPYVLEDLVPDEDPVRGPVMFSVRPSLMALDDGTSVASVDSKTSYSWQDLIPLINTSDKFGISYTEYVPGSNISIPGSDPIVFPGVTYQGGYPKRGLTPNVVRDANWIVFYADGINVPSSINASYSEDLLIGTPVFCESLDEWSNKLLLDIDVSGLSPFSTFELNGLIHANSYAMIVSSGTVAEVVDLIGVDVLINGVLQKSYSTSTGAIDFGGFFYNGSAPVESLQLRLNFDLVGFDYTQQTLSANVQVSEHTTLSLSILQVDDVLPSVNDEAQDKLNEHESIESQWTGSMTENFNALDLSGFSYPEGLVAAFALITGIFNDLWNGMGEYKILYVFPLTLGVVLLLIGRISKFSGRGSTGKSGKGDDSA